MIAIFIVIFMIIVIRWMSLNYHYLLGIITAATAGVIKSAALRSDGCEDQCDEASG